MTLLDDIATVHDGVANSKSRTYMESANTMYIHAHALSLMTPAFDAIDYEAVYVRAKEVAIAAVQMMQLASDNVEREQSELRALPCGKEPDYCEEIRQFMVEYSKLNDLQMPPTTKTQSLCDSCGLFDTCGGQVMTNEGSCRMYRIC